MNCLVCDRFAPPDSETGYDCDELCSECHDQGYYMDTYGNVYREFDDDDESFVVRAENAR